MTSIIKVDNIQNSSGTAAATVASNGALELNVGGVITEYDQWRLNANTSLSDNDVISSNLERVDTDGFEKIGTGMSQSSGTWTFPSTGFYIIRWYFAAQRTDGSSSELSVQLQTSTNSGTSYSAAATGRSSGAQNDFGFGSGEFLFKVAGTSTHLARFRFQTGSGSGTQLIGSSNNSISYFTFVKIAHA